MILLYMNQWIDEWIYYNKSSRLVKDGWIDTISILISKWINGCNKSSIQMNGCMDEWIQWNWNGRWMDTINPLCRWMNGRRKGYSKSSGWIDKIMPLMNNWLEECIQ